MAHFFTFNRIKVLQCTTWNTRGFFLIFRYRIQHVHFVLFETKPGLHSKHFPVFRCQLFALQMLISLNLTSFNVVATVVQSLRLKGRNPHRYLSGQPKFFPRQACEKIGLFFVYKRSRRVKGLWLPLLRVLCWDLIGYYRLVITGNLFLLSLQSFLSLRGEDQNLPYPEIHLAYV